MRPQKRVPAVVVAEQVGSARHAFVRVLDVIEAVLVGLPHLDPGVRDRWPSTSVTVPSTQHGWPSAPPAMSPPLSMRGEFSVKNGPKTVASVASPWATLLTLIVCIDAPRTSDSRMNSCGGHR